MGLTALTLFTTCLLVVRNQRVLTGLHHPAGPPRAAGRGRTVAHNPPPAPQDTHQPRRTAITGGRHRTGRRPDTTHKHHRSDSASPGHAHQRPDDHSRCGREGPLIFRTTDPLVSRVASDFTV